MGIKKLLVLWGIVAGTQLFAQNVTNVDCYQDGNNITITYNVDQKASTELFYSLNGGTTFTGPLKCVTGDIGANAKKGYNKAIWSVLDEVESLNGNNIVFKVAVSNPFGIEMVFVEGGTFTLGPSGNESKLVTVSSFYISKYEISQQVWKSIMGSNPSQHKGDDYPVENVSWDYVQMFIERLNAVTGLKYRLPTEAEWEYAAEGGKKGRNYSYPGYGQLTKNVACYSAPYTRSVKEGWPNELGLYNMAGNVAEYCLDGYGAYSDLKTSVNPMGKSKKQIKVMRGGSWRSSAENCKVNRRDFVASNNYSAERGFRLVLVIE